MFLGLQALFLAAGGWGGGVKNSMGNGEAKELTCTWTRTKVGECWWEGGYRVEGSKGEKKMGQL